MCLFPRVTWHLGDPASAQPDPCRSGYPRCFGWKCTYTSTHHLLHRSVLLRYIPAFVTFGLNPPPGLFREHCSYLQAVLLFAVVLVSSKTSAAASVQLASLQRIFAKFHKAWTHTHTHPTCSVYRFIPESLLQLCLYYYLELSHCRNPQEREVVKST